MGGWGFQYCHSKVKIFLLSGATLKKSFVRKFGESWELDSNPGLLMEKRKRFLCASGHDNGLEVTQT